MTIYRQTDSHIRKLHRNTTKNKSSINAQKVEKSTYSSPEIRLAALFAPNSSMKLRNQSELGIEFGNS